MMSGGVFEAQTNGVRVRVRPVFLEQQSAPAESRYVWAYHVEIENRGAATLQLMTRHWRITDGDGRLQEVRGDGVVGEQPVLEPGERFTYTSGCPLHTPSGLMVGSYQFVDAHGAPVEVAIPAFSLDSPYEARRPS